MNREMAYLLGMICGNGEIQRGSIDTTVSIEIPHKKLATENNNDVRIYVRASITDIRNIIEPLIGTGIQFIQQDNYSVLSFTKPNTEYIMREILRYIGNAVSHDNIRIDNDVFSFSRDERISFLQGFADVSNLLKSIDIPVQAIDWAHPNMRDGNLKKYNEGKPDFWKKEHQVKIWANEFLPIGFAVIHKKEALESFAQELIAGLEAEGKNPYDVTHKYYWEGRNRNSEKPLHPGENDLSIPSEIRGNHYNTWKEIAEDLGYGE